MTEAPFDSRYKNFYYFDFTEELTETSKLKCANCKKWIPFKDWQHIEMYCDICGDHAGLQCPECSEQYDHVWDDETIEVRNGD